MQQYQGLCLAVNPPPFNKGGKCDGAKQVIVRFWEDWCGARGCCPFAMVAGMERFDAMGGTSKARTLCGARGYCLFAMVVGMERVDATGGASKARMPEMNAQRLCKDAKPTERS